MEFNEDLDFIHGVSINHRWPKRGLNFVTMWHTYGVQYIEDYRPLYRFHDPAQMLCLPHCACLFWCALKHDHLPILLEYVWRQILDYLQPCYGGCGLFFSCSSCNE